MWRRKWARSTHKKPVLKGSETLSKIIFLSVKLALRNVVLVRVYTRLKQHAHQFAPLFLKVKREKSCEKIHTNESFLWTLHLFEPSRAWKWIAHRNLQHESNVITLLWRNLRISSRLFCEKNQYRMKKEEKNPQSDNEWMWKFFFRVKCEISNFCQWKFKWWKKVAVQIFRRVNSGQKSSKNIERSLREILKKLKSQIFMDLKVLKKFVLERKHLKKKTKLFCLRANLHSL